MKTGFLNFVLMLALIVGALSAPALAQRNTPSPWEPAGNAPEPTIKGNSITAPHPEQVPIDTPVVTQAELLAEGFEDGFMPPTGWSVTINHPTRNWTIVDIVTDDPDFVYAGTYAAWVNYEALSASDEWLFTPSIDLTGVPDAALSFWAFSDTNWCPGGGSGATMLVHATDTGGTPISTLWDMCADENWSSTTYRQVIVDLSAFEDQNIKLAWQYEGIDGQSFGLDDISLTGTLGNAGWLQGHVADAEMSGGDPTCSDALVSVDGNPDAPVNQDGSYGPVLVSEGTRIVTASAPGYSTDSTTVSVVDDVITTQDFYLSRPVIEVTPSDFVSISAPIGEPTNYSLTIDNNGHEPLDFEIQELAPGPVRNTMVTLEYGPEIEVEPQLLAQLKSDEAAGYTVYFREKPDLTPAFGMDWRERGWFVMNTLQDTAQRSQARVRAHLDAQGIQYQAFWIDNVIVIESSSRSTFNSLLDFPEIAALRARRAMQVIEPVSKTVSSDQVPMAIEPNISHVKANDVWGLGYNGEGIVVANIDTGVRYTHNALVSQYRGNLGGGSYDHDYNWLDPEAGRDTPFDEHGHGTHTMGTMVGDDGGSNQIGMAPNAKWIACDACNSSNCPDAALLTCAQWVIAPYPKGEPASANPDLRAHVVNNSWGDCERSYNSWYQGSINAWHAAGIYPIFSNGNASNCSYSAPPGCNTVGNPARYGNVTGVGSTGQSNGLYATHSNWGPTDNPDTINPAGYANLKPQVMAPGVNIRSSLNGSNSAYASWGGTSMSAPHVSGLIALMWQAAPCLMGDYATTEAIVLQTATDIPYVTNCGGEGPGNVPNQATGWGEINALAAVQEARNHCTMADLPWITQDPISGTIAATNSIDIDVTVLCTEATEHVGTLKVLHNDPCESSVEVPILLHCQEDLPGEWDKWIDGEPWSPGISVTRETSDTIEIIDVISSALPFTLTEMWDSSHLVLIDHELDPPGAGSVTTTNRKLQWTRLSGPAEPITLTKRFHVETCTWGNTILREELWLDGGIFEQRDITVNKDTPDLWIDAAYEPEVGAGDLATFSLLYGNSGGYENDVRVRSEFVAEGRFASSDPSPDRFSTVGLWAEWDVGDLAKDDFGSIDVTVEIAGGLVPSDTVDIWSYILNHVGWDVGSSRITYHIADTVCEPITGVDFDPAPSNPQTGEIVTFAASPQPPTAKLPITYQWSFDDGGTATGNPVYHSYIVSGTYSVNVTATNACGGPVSATQTVTVTGQTVTPVYAVELTPTADEKRALPGTDVSYGLMVRNTGDTADTFDLSFKDQNGWMIDITPPSVNLLPNKTAPVVVTISIPPGVAAGDSDVATISVTSQGDPAVMQKSTLTTSVWEFDVFLPLVFKK